MRASGHTPEPWKIKLAWTIPDHRAHYYVSVFVGPDRDHLALAGTLTMRPEEAERFRFTIRMGIEQPGFTGIFESGWEDED